MDKKVVFSTRIEPELLDKVRALSRKTGVRITHIASQALARYLRAVDK